MSLTKDDLKNMKISCIEYQPEACSMRLSDSEVTRFKEKETLLAKKIGNIKIKYEIEHKLGPTKAYEELEEVCQISITKLKYAISCRKGNTANRNFLYKFCVGLHMTLEEANELFELENGALSEECLADKICMCALRDKDDIFTFINEFEERTNLKIAMRERKG